MSPRQKRGLLIIGLVLTPFIVGLLLTRDYQDPSPRTWRTRFS
jgi:hypothetical protein